MSTLVIAEHDNSTLNPATLNAVAAAQALGGDIDILVAGAGCADVAAAAQKVAGIRKVLSADNAAYEHAAIVWTDLTLWLGFVGLFAGATIWRASLTRAWWALRMEALPSTMATSSRP